jgi:hypothetical protein
MVTRTSSSRRRIDGGLSIELIVAIALLTVAVLPVAYSFAAEKRLARAEYQRALAMEIVDGEMEILTAGDWRSFQPGSHEYPVSATAITNLPPGRFLLDVETNRLRLEWRPSMPMRGGSVVREITLR